MDIQIGGNRANLESWLRAHQMPISELPTVSPEEHLVAERLGLSDEEYSRSKYATAQTALELEDRARQLGAFVQHWLASHGVEGQVCAVFLKTFEGRYRLKLQVGESVRLVTMEEEVVDDLFERGSKQAKHQVSQVLALNLLPGVVTKTS